MNSTIDFNIKNLIPAVGVNCNINNSSCDVGPLILIKL